MMISLRLNDEDSMLFKKYAEMHGMTLSELMRQATMERIEDEYDLKAYENAIAEYKKDPVTYSHEEVARILDLE